MPPRARSTCPWPPRTTCRPRPRARRRAGADAAVFLSEYEGFGLPVLEAMVRGVPVVASRRPALDDLFGGGALLVEPADEEAVAAAVNRVLADRRVRADLVRRGYGIAAS